MVLNPGDVYFENMFSDATRILEGGLWHNNVPVGNDHPVQTAAAPAASTVASPPVSRAPAAPVAIANAGATPIDMHHSSFTEMAHHIHQMWG
jgi:hypothetical protein